MSTHLQSENADTARSLHQNGLPRLQRLQSVQSIPTCESSAREGAGLKVIEILWALDQAILIKDTILAESTVDNTTKTRAGSLVIDGTILVTLVEQSDDLVTLLELGDLGSGVNHLTGTIGARDDGEVQRKRIFTLQPSRKSTVSKEA